MSLVSEAQATTASPQLALELGLTDRAGADFLNRPPRSTHETRTGAQGCEQPGRTGANGCEPARTENPVFAGTPAGAPQLEHSRRWYRTTAVPVARLGLRDGRSLLLTDAYEIARDAVTLAWRTGALLGLNSADGPVALPASDVLRVSEVWS